MNEDDTGLAFWRAMLDLRMATGRYSSLFAHQIFRHFEDRTASPWPILREIEHLEGLPNLPLQRTKPPAELTRKLLKGLWHKHYSQAAFIPKNVSNHIRKGAVDAAVGEILHDASLTIEEKAARIARTIVFSGYKERGAAQEVTGEWIVYARLNGVNYYLTLGVHRDDQAICDRCRACLAEFPELRNTGGPWSREPC